MRFLFVSHVPPYPTNSGGRQRSRFIIDALRLHGEVDILLLRNPYNEDLASDQNPTCEKDRTEIDHYAPHWSFDEPDLTKTAPFRMLRKFLGQHAAHAIAYHFDGGRRHLKPHPPLQTEVAQSVDHSAYDWIVARYVRGVASCGLLSTGKVLLDLDDYAPDLLKARIPTVDPMTRTTLRRILRHTEVALPDIFRQCRSIWISNAGDRRHPGLSDAIVLPNLAFLPKGIPTYVPPPQDTSIILAVGTWTYSANREGIAAFVRQCWDEILRQHPKAILRIVGKGSEELPEFTRQAKQVELIGFAPDLALHYRDARFFLAPIRFGGGTNIKVLEGAAYGRTGVLTPIAFRGYANSFPDPPPFRIATNPRETILHCLELLKTPDLAEDLGCQARLGYLHAFSLDRFHEAIRGGIPSLRSPS